jgi:hypothetical protein
MATAILFIGWNRPATGNEDTAWKFLISEALPIIKKWEGKYFERSEPFGLTPHGGELNGGIILFGERAKLDELRRTDEFETWSMRLNSMFTRYGVVPGVNWDGMQGVMKRSNLGR